MVQVVFADDSPVILAAISVGELTRPRRSPATLVKASRTAHAGSLRFRVVSGAMDIDGTNVGYHGLVGRLMPDDRE